MAVSTTIGTDLTQVNDDMRSYFEEYFRSIGKDPATCFAPDGTLIDTDLKNDPAFQVYWQTAYMQMMEVVEPSLINSLESSVGEIDFDALYDNPSVAMTDFMSQLDPEIRACLDAVDGYEEGGSLISTLNSNSSSSSSEDSDGESNESVAFLQSSLYLSDETTLSYDADARAFAETYDLGEGYTWMIGFTEGQGALSESLLDLLSQSTQARAQINADIANGLDANTASSRLAELTMNEQILFSSLQDVIGTTNTITEMYSKLVEQQTDIMMKLTNAIKVSA